MSGEEATTVDVREVEIVYARDPETDGPDVDRPGHEGRIGKRVVVSKAEARRMVSGGEARYADIPRDDAGRELATMTRGQVVAHAQAVGIGVTADMSKSNLIARIGEIRDRAAAEADREALGKLTKDELRAKLAEVDAEADVPASATKDELVAAIIDARTKPAVHADDEPAAEPGPVTVLPGAEANPNPAETRQP